MVDVTLNPNEENQDSAVREIEVALPPSPAIREARPAEEPPTVEEPSKQEGIAQGLMPDPYLKASEPAIEEAMRYRPEILGLYTQEPTPGSLASAIGDSQEVTENENRILATATGFVAKDENGQDIFLRFDMNDEKARNMPIGLKRRKIMRNNTSYALYDVDEAGNVLLDENDQPIKVDLGLTQERQRYLEGAPQNMFSKSVQFVSELIGGPTGAGDLQDIDNELINFGMKNQHARTLVLRNIATGVYDGEQVFRDLKDLGVFAVTIPGMGADLVKNVTGEVLEWSLRNHFDYSAEDATKFRERSETFGKGDRRGLFTELLDLKDHFELQYFTEEKAGGMYSPEVIEEAFASRGLYNTAMRHATTEGPLYAMWGAYRVYSAAKTLVGFRGYLKEQYGSEDLAVAFRTALKEDKYNTPRKVMEDFANTQSRQSAVAKTRRDLDISLGMAISRPGYVAKNLRDDWKQGPSKTGKKQQVKKTIDPEAANARRAVLQDQMDDIQARIEQRQKVMDAARRQGKEEFAKREEKAILKLRGEQRQILYGVLTPKYMRDLKGEATMTIGAMSAANELSIQMGMFGQDNVWVPEAMTAVMVGLDIPKLNPARYGIGLLEASATTLKEISDIYQDVRAVGLEGKILLQEMKKRAKSRSAQNVLKKAIENGDEYSTMFLQGLSLSAERRGELVVFSEDYGIDLDPDAFTTNLAIMSQMGALIDISKQLDDRMTVTGVKDMSGAVVEATNVHQQRIVLLSKLVEGTRKIVDATFDADVPDDNPIKIMARNLQAFAITQENILRKDMEHIQKLNELNSKTINATLKAEHIVSAEDGGEGLLATLDRNTEDRIEAATNSISVANQMGLPDTVAELAVALKKLDEIKQQNLAITTQMTKALRVDEAHTGQQSVAFAKSAIDVMGIIDANTAKLYSKFDSQAGTVHADVTTFYNDYMGREGVPEFGVPEDVSPEVADFGKYKTVAPDKKGFAAMFNGAARQGMENQFGENLQNILESFDIVDLPPIEQRAVLKDKLGYDLPLLMTTAEWRIVNKQLGRQIRRINDPNQETFYLNLKQQWQAVSDPASPMAFMKDYSTNPTVVAEEIYAVFREAQDYYHRNKVQRYQGGLISKIEAEVTKDTKEAVQTAKQKGVDLTEDQVAKLMEKAPDELSPYVWLDSILKGTTDMGNIGGGKLQVQLYNKISRYGGVYDEKSGKYFLITESDLPEDQDFVNVAKNMQVQVTRHLQGVLASKFGDVLPKNAAGRTLFDPRLDIPYDENTFRAFYNIPKYRRNADGSISQIVDAQGNPQYLFNENEVFESIDIDAYRRNRPDMEETFEEADELVKTIEEETLSPYGSYESLVKSQRQDLEFMSQVYRALTGGDIRAEVRAGTTADGTPVTAYNVDSVMAEALYNKVIGGDNLDLERLQKLFEDQGMPVEESTRLIKASVNRVLIDKSQTYIGNHKFTVDGVITDTAEYGFDTQKLREIMGEPGSPERARLEKILGTEAIETWDLITDTVDNYINSKSINSGVDVRRTVISLDSVLSRIYNINRGVVSPQWVATESLIRASRQHGGKLLNMMLTDSKIAKEVLDIIQTGNIPEYKVTPDWLRALTMQIVQAEGLNEAMWEFKQETMGGRVDPTVRSALSAQPADKPNPLIAAINTMEDPDKLRQIAERERLTPEKVQQDIEKTFGTRDSIIAEMKGFGYSDDYLNLLKQSQQQ